MALKYLVCVWVYKRPQGFTTLNLRQGQEVRSSYSNRASEELLTIDYFEVGKLAIKGHGNAVRVGLNCYA